MILLAALEPEDYCAPEVQCLECGTWTDDLIEGLCANCYCIKEDEQLDLGEKRVWEDPIWRRFYF